LALLPSRQPGTVCFSFLGVSSAEDDVVEAQALFKLGERQQPANLTAWCRI
jgi:hypothetical protein